MEAAEALREYLKDNGWTDVKLQPIREQDALKELAANTVAITVGLKPLTYFLPEGEKKMHDLIEERTDKALREQFHQSKKP